MLFFRDNGMFYPIDPMPGIDLKKQAADNAELNPGTIRVEDFFGNILWEKPTCH